MSGNRSKPDLTFVNLIHQSLRADAARLAATVTALDPSDQASRLPGIRAFFDQYRAQLAMHHTHEDELFFPALKARVGAGRMQLNALAGQHEALDACHITAWQPAAARPATKVDVVPDVEQPPDQRDGPGQRPPLVLAPAVRRRTQVQRGPQPGQRPDVEDHLSDGLTNPGICISVY
jgi:hypothetical protein